MTAVVAAQIMQLLIVAKHPSPHYLIPALSMMPALAVILAAPLRRRRPASLWMFVGVLLLLLVFQIARLDIPRWYRTHFQEYSQSSAMQFGNWWSGRRYSHLVREIYGGD